MRSKIITCHSSQKVPSGRLQNHGFQNIRDVFTLIRGGFQDLVNFLLLDHFDGIRGIFKQAGNAFAFDAVGFLFQQSELLAVFQHVLGMV